MYQVCYNEKNAAGRCAVFECPVCWPGHIAASVTADSKPHAFSAELDAGSDLETAQLESFYKLILTGVRVLPDHTGMMCPSNGYILVVGERFYAKLAEFARKVKHD